MKRLGRWRTLGSTPLLFATACVLTGCPDEGAGSDRPIERDARYQVGACPFTAPKGVDVECGTLTVPENHEKPEGNQLELAVARFSSTGNKAAPDPLVYLSGGPGGAGILEVVDALALFAPTLEERHLIVVDQRGTGFSKPQLGCETDEGVTSSEDELRVLEECRAALDARGIDRSQYSTLNSAKDLRELREALAIERWNAMGVSYGTRLVLEMMREDPEGVRAAVLDSALPPDLDTLAETPRAVQDSLELIFETCAADEACRLYFPELKSRFYALLEQLDAEPVRVSVFGKEVEVDGAGLVDALGGLLYTSHGPTVVAGAVASLEMNDLELLTAMVEEDAASDTDFAIGMYMSVVCAEWAPITSEASLEAAIRDVHPAIVAAHHLALFADACERWDVPAAPARSFTAVKSDTPTLILAGAYDPATPPSWGEHVQKTLPNAHFSLFRGASHGVFFSECGASFVADFLRSPGEVEDPSCVERTEPLPFGFGADEEEKSARREEPLVAQLPLMRL